MHTKARQSMVRIREKKRGRRKGETHSNSVSENSLFVKFVNSSHDVGSELVVLVVVGRVANDGFVRGTRLVLDRRVVDGIGFVDGFGTRDDANGPGTLVAIQFINN